MNRPTGVSVLAILLFIFAGLLVLLAAAAFLGGAFLGSIIGSSAQQAGAGAAGAGLGAAIGAVFGFGFIVGAILNVVCGYGLWNLREWGRMLTIILNAIAVVFGVFGLFISMIHFHIIGLFFVILRLAIHALIIWYLSQPHVKAAFVTQPQVYPAH